jgi:hypothetical protein
MDSNADSRGGRKEGRKESKTRHIVIARKTRSGMTKTQLD